MNYKEFLKTIESQQPPAGLPELLRSLWWDRKLDWDMAHSIAQEIPLQEEWTNLVEEMLKL